jgi:preprotein translocase subunit Sss1
LPLLFLLGNAQEDNIMLLIAGIVLVISGVVGFIIQLSYIQEKYKKNAEAN